MRLNRCVLMGWLLCSWIPAVYAVEGMWVPQQLTEMAAPLQEAGLQLAPQQLADVTGDPMGAVVALGNCTASFVSPNGLVVTNHHCAYGAIQLNSSADNNLLENGFNAPTLEEEVSAGPNARIYVLDSVIDVTENVHALLAREKENNPIQRSLAIEALEKQLIADCEAEDGYRCTLYKFFGGLHWRLFKNLEIKDVRLVYAPPESIGKFGGDIDNWMWPRHTGDFAFYRAYVGPEGQPATFSTENVPYQPKHWLKLANQPLSEGDFVMVAGYPGRTDRYALASEFENIANWFYPTVSRLYKQQAELVETMAASDPDIALKYANHLAAWNNTSKNFDSQLQGFTRNYVLAQKQQEEKAVLDWLKNKSNRASRTDREHSGRIFSLAGVGGRIILNAHQQLHDLGYKAREHQERDLMIRMLNSTGTLGTAVRLYRLAIEREKPDIQRQLGYQQRDWPVIEGGLRQMDQRYVPAMDRQLQHYWLQQLWALPDTRYRFDDWFASAITIPSDSAALQENELLTALTALLEPGTDPEQEAIKKVGQQVISKIVAHLDQSRLGELEQRLYWFNADRAAFEASNDPAIEYAVAIMPLLLDSERQQKIRQGEELLLRPLFLQAVADYKSSKNEFIYPDANLSLRITFGHVKGYNGLDGTPHLPFTSIEGVAAKQTGNAPFNSPHVLLDAVAEKRYSGLEDTHLGSVPVNFLADLDITGGNSGSPVLNARGHLVGLAFDGTWESVASNWVFDPVMTRMIAVDQRYMQWIMREVAPAPQLLQELERASK